MRKGSLAIMFCAALLICLVPSSVLLAEEKEKEEGAEVKMKLDQVPEAARKTLTEEAKGAAIEEVAKITEDGKTVYETDVKIGDKEYEIQVAEDGTLICKKLEMDDEEKGGKEDDEKGEKNEKNEKNEKESK